MKHLKHIVSEVGRLNLTLWVTCLLWMAPKPLQAAAMPSYKVACATPDPSRMVPHKGCVKTLPPVQADLAQLPEAVNLYLLQGVPPSLPKAVKEPLLKLSEDAVYNFIDFRRADSAGCTLQHLHAVADIGLQTLNYLQDGSVPDPAWFTQSTNTLEHAAHSHCAAASLAAKAVGRLVDACRLERR
jgi:hypothetical protein